MSGLGPAAIGFVCAWCGSTRREKPRFGRPVSSEPCVRCPFCGACVRKMLPSGRREVLEPDEAWLPIKSGALADPLRLGEEFVVVTAGRTERCRVGRGTVHAVQVVDGTEVYRVVPLRRDDPQRERRDDGRWYRPRSGVRGRRADWSAGDDTSHRRGDDAEWGTFDAGAWGWPFGGEGGPGA